MCPRPRRTWLPNSPKRTITSHPHTVSLRLHGQHVPKRFPSLGLTTVVTPWLQCRMLGLSIRCEVVTLLAVVHQESLPTLSNKTNHRFIGSLSIFRTTTYVHGYYEHHVKQTGCKFTSLGSEQHLEEHISTFKHHAQTPRTQDRDS